MYLPEQPFQWSAQLGPSLTNSYDSRQHFDRGIKNPEGKSRLRSPIPSDPGYGDEIRPFSAPCGVGHVLRLHGSDAKNIYKRATASDGAPYFLNVQRSSMLHTNNRTGKPSKNYMNENVKRIRRIMRDNQQRHEIKSESQPTPVKALWHSKQYDHVQSKVKQRLDEDKQHSSSRSASAQGDYLRAHANTGPKVLRSQSVSDLRRTSLTTEVDHQTKPDYVKINSQYVKHIPKVRKTTSAEAAEQTREKQAKDLQAYKEKQKGRVPDYIEKIKEKRDQDIYEAHLNAPDIECPPGHIKVDNNQRIATLQQLQFNRAELEKRYSHLPIRNDSLSLRRTKEEIEKKIVELDEAIQIFSKPKVFIQIDQ